MTVTRDIILDILPLYFSGQASADTRMLVDEFLAADPDFARMSRRFDQLLTERDPKPTSGDAIERRAFERTRRLLRYRNQMIGFAVGYSLVPFAFLFRSGRIEWIMFRDHPAMAVKFALVAVACWIVVGILGIRARRTSSEQSR
jgi:hypothetical protein